MEVLRWHKPSQDTFIGWLAFFLESIKMEKSMSLIRQSHCSGFDYIIAGEISYLLNLCFRRAAKFLIRCLLLIFFLVKRQRQQLKTIANKAIIRPKDVPRAMTLVLSPCLLALPVKKINFYMLHQSYQSSTCGVVVDWLSVNSGHGMDRELPPHLQPSGWAESQSRGSRMVWW